MPVDALSPSQEAAVAALICAFATEQEAILVGPAGSGKTWLASRAASRLIDAGLFGCVRYLAPTGKAALRLSQLTGVPAVTIHRALYGAPLDCEVWKPRVPTGGTAGGAGAADEGPEEVRLVPVYNADGRVGVAAAVQAENAERVAAGAFPFCPTGERKLRFGGKAPRRPRRDADGFELEEPDNDDTAAIPTAGLVVVDEASMVNVELARDLRAAVQRVRGAGLLWVGDREQLAPVEGRWGVDLDHPTAALQEIHRQAAGSPVLQAATEIRHGRRLPYDLGDLRWLVYRNVAGIDAPAAWLVEMRNRGVDATLLTYTNPTRRAVNARVRALRGVPDRDLLPEQATRTLVVPGDTLVCLVNDYARNWRNGDIATVAAAEITPDGRPFAGSIEVQFAGREDEKPIRIHPPIFGADVSLYRDWIRQLGTSAVEKGNWLHFDYGECLTVHKAQGSQWARVGIVWDGACSALFHRAGEPDAGRRWAYTAITRAAVACRIWMV